MRRRASVVVLLLSWSPVMLAPPAGADTVEMLTSAVQAARSASCGPLRQDPVVQQAAENVNRSNALWLEQMSRAQPVPDAMPLLKDLGYGGSKATILYGAGKNEADSIKALLLQGYLKIPDCSFSDLGVSVMQENSAGWILSTVVLAA